MKEKTKQKIIAIGIGIGIIGFFISGGKPLPGFEETYYMRQIISSIMIIIGAISGIYYGWNRVFPKKIRKNKN